MKVRRPHLRLFCHTHKPRLRMFLDMNGTVTAEARFLPDTWGTWRHERAGYTNISYAPQLSAELLHLANRPGVEVVWVTTMGEKWARKAAETMGLPFSRALEPPEMLYATGDGDTLDMWWKLIAVRDECRDGVPFIWADDLLFYSEPAVGWLNTLDRSTFLALCPDSGGGLTPDDVAQMSEWSRKVLDNTN